MSKVLLVEDDNNLREIYEARLQAEGYEIRSAQDGEQALVVAKEFKPDLVISDVMMPKISGFEMLDILRNTDGLKNTRVIMLTALGQAEDKTRADSLGADRYLVKSQVTLEDIIKAAEDVLGDGGAAQPAAVAATVATDTPPSDVPVATAPADPAPVVAPEPELAIAPSEPVAKPTLEPSTVTNVPVTEPIDAPAEPAAPAAETPSVAPEDVVTPAPAAEAPAVPVADEQVEPIVPAAPTTATETPAFDPNVGATTVMPTTEAPVAPTETPVSAPEPVTEPTAEPAEAPAASTADFGSTASEQATVDQQIQDFIAHAPSADTPQPAVVEPVVTTPEAPTAEETTDQTHQDLLNDAVNSLAGDDATTTITPQTITPTPTPETVEAPTSTPVPVSKQDDTIGDSVTIAKKKIIQPLETEPRPSLDELLAREEARDITGNDSPASTDFTPPTPTTSDPVTPNPKTDDDFNPNNIAL